MSEIKIPSYQTLFDEFEKAGPVDNTALEFFIFKYQPRDTDKDEWRTWLQDLVDEVYAKGRADLVKQQMAMLAVKNRTKVRPPEAAKRCPYYDNDCKQVRDYIACWSGLDTDDPFPGVCPFVFGESSENTNS